MNGGGLRTRQPQDSSKDEFQEGSDGSAPTAGRSPNQVDPDPRTPPSSSDRSSSPTPGELNGHTTRPSKELPPSSALTIKQGSPLPHHAKTYSSRTLAILDNRRGHTAPNDSPSQRWRRGGERREPYDDRDESLSLPRLIVPDEQGDGQRGASAQDPAAVRLPPISSLVDFAERERVSAREPSTRDVNMRDLVVDEGGPMDEDDDERDAEAEEEDPEWEGGESSSDHHQPRSAAVTGINREQRHRDWDRGASTTHYSRGQLPRGPGGQSYPSLPSPIPPHDYRALPPVHATAYTPRRQDNHHHPQVTSTSLPPPPQTPTTASSSGSRSPSVPTIVPPGSSSRQQRQPQPPPSPTSSTATAIPAPPPTTPASNANPSLARPHKCELCQLAFARAHDLKRHVMTHTGEKRFKCPNCGKAYGRKDALKRHACQSGYEHGMYGVVPPPSGSSSSQGGWSDRERSMRMLESPPFVAGSGAGAGTVMEGEQLRRTASWNPSSRSAPSHTLLEDEPHLEAAPSNSAGGPHRTSSARIRTRSIQHRHGPPPPSAGHGMRSSQSASQHLNVPPMVGAAHVLVNMASSSSSSSSENRPRAPAFHPPMRPPSVSPEPPPQRLHPSMSVSSYHRETTSRAGTHATASEDDDELESGSDGEADGEAEAEGEDAEGEDL